MSTVKAGRRTGTLGYPIRVEAASRAAFRSPSRRRALAHGSATLSRNLPFTILLVALALVAITVATISQSRRRLLSRIRIEWGKPRSRGRKMDAIRESHRSRLAVAGSSASLDERTWDDLNLDAVFVTVDRTESTLGQHALYHRLRSAPVADHLDAFDALVTRLTGDVPTRERAQLALSRLQDAHGYDLWWLGQPGAVDTPSWYVVFPVLTACTAVTVLLGILWFHLLPLVFVAIGVGVAIRYATDHRISAAVGAFRQLAPVIATAQALAFLSGDDVDPIVGSIRREVPHLVRLKTIARWLGANPFLLSLDAPWLLLAASDLANLVYEYLNLALLLDANAVFFGGRQLRARAPGLLHTMAAIGEVDAAIGVASFRAGTDGWTRPRFCQSGAPVVLTDLRHPLVRDAVPNSIRLGPPHGVLVTGSNMSGKSTWLRTVGVSAVLAQTVNTCLATEYEAPVFNVRSCIGRADDLEAGKSYYLVEVEALLALVQASADASPHLFLLDELFRGTNAVERIAAGEAVLRELIGEGNDLKPHIVVAATHDGELVDLVKDRYAAYHFGDAIGPNGLMFDYHLLSGPATARNAITLLQLQGAPESLVNRALGRAAALDRERKAAWTG
jgi:hypothetical protein